MTILRHLSLALVLFPLPALAQETTTAKDGFVYKMQDATGNTVQNGPVPDGAVTQTTPPRVPPSVPANTGLKSDSANGGLPGDMQGSGLKGDLTGAPLKSDMDSKPQ